MLSKCTTFFIALTVLMTVGVVPSQAKKVICVDGCNSEFVNNHEGFERQVGLGPGGVIQVGGNLTDCLAQVANGDNLIIIAHGTGTGTGFIWGGVTYTGFGNGANELPVPAGFANRMNVTVRFCSCWSARDPDGGGANKSLVDKIIDAMGGAANGHAGSGFNDIATACVSYDWNGGTEAQCDAAGQCLEDDPSWMRNPPTTRPGAATTQQTAAQALVDACPGAGGAGVVTITITKYKAPVNTVQDPPPGSGAGGCSCTSNPGCGFGTQAGDATSVPAISGWGLLVVALLILTAGWLVLGRPRAGEAQA